MPNPSLRTSSDQRHHGVVKPGPGVAFYLESRRDLSMTVIFVKKVKQIVSGSYRGHGGEDAR